VTKIFAKMSFGIAVYKLILALHCLLQADPAKEENIKLYVLFFKCDFWSIYFFSNMYTQW
jgi:hypothetical protein